MSQFLCVSAGPVVAPGVDTSDAAVFADGLVTPGQIVRASENPDPASFRDVTPAGLPAVEPPVPAAPPAAVGPPAVEGEASAAEAAADPAVEPEPVPAAVDPPADIPAPAEPAAV